MKCKGPECDKVNIRARGLCPAHYEQQRKGKNLTPLHKAPPMISQTFNRLTVLKEVERRRKYFRYFLCRCTCGTEKIIRGERIYSGTTKSCGCLARELTSERARTHGQGNKKDRSPTYNSWRSMKDRCHNPNATGYERYGKRGIVVCDRWRNSFENFFSDMGERPENTSLDRIDNDGNYEPGNCRWATAAEQNANRRVLVDDTADTASEG